MPIMYSLLVLIAELLYLMNLIVAHARQCHKSSYVRSITSSLSPHKIFVNVLLINTLCITRKKSFPNDMNITISMLLENPEMTSILFEFCSSLHIWT